MPYHRKLDEVVDAVRRVKGADRRCAVLIGAGCSVSAGIPLAKGFVEEIRKKYLKEYKRAKEKTYAQCMAELAPGLRRELIRPHIEKAKINWLTWPSRSSWQTVTWTACSQPTLTRF